jgi:hypothetical protein
MVKQLKKLLLFVAVPALAQNDDVAAYHVANGGSNSTPGTIQSQTSRGLTIAHLRENPESIAGRSSH